MPLGSLWWPPHTRGTWSRVKKAELPQTGNGREGSVQFGLPTISTELKPDSPEFSRPQPPRASTTCGQFAFSLELPLQGGLLQILTRSRSTSPSHSDQGLHSPQAPPDSGADPARLERRATRRRRTNPMETKDEMITGLLFSTSHLCTRASHTTCSQAILRLINSASLVEVNQAIK